MNDDLVKRLRETAGQYDEHAWHHDIELEAADCIEELGAALRLIADTDPAGDPHWPGRIARFVLDGKTDD